MFANLHLIPTHVLEAPPQSHPFSRSSTAIPTHVVKAPPLSPTHVLKARPLPPIHVLEAPPPVPIYVFGATMNSRCKDVVLSYV